MILSGKEYMKKISVILFIALLCITAVCAADEISEDVIIRLREHCYVSPQGGEMLHTDQNCRIVHEKYLPLTEIEFSESLLNQYSLCPVCSASNQPEALVELSCGKVEYLNYQCTLPDGRLLLTGGTRRDEIGGDAAWIMCLNTDRTISWEYISRKDGFTAAENAVVLTDGTIAVIMEDYPKKRAAMFFSPDGKKARKQLDLKEKRGILYTITPSFMMTYEDASKKAEEYRCKTFLYDWNGKEITRYDGLIMKDGYGFIVPNDDECVFYGHDDVFNGHAMIQKLDESLDKALWETKLDWQLPGSDTAVLEYALKTSDGGYVAWLREGCPGEDEWSSYEWSHFLVKFDADGRLMWVKGKDEYGPDTGNLFVYDGKIAILCSDGLQIDASRSVRWLDMDGKMLGMTDVKLNSEDFKVLRDYLEPENPGEKRTTIVDQQQFISMGDELWVMATCFVADDLGEEGFSTIYDSQEIIMFKVPEI